MATKRMLSPGERILKRLANEVLTKVTRLRNKASLVASDPSPGRNLTALRNTAAELMALLEEIQKPRCWCCGCTEDKACKGGCAWVDHRKRDLCTACVP